MSRENGKVDSPDILECCAFLDFWSGDRLGVDVLVYLEASLFRFLGVETDCGFIAIWGGEKEKGKPLCVGLPLRYVKWCLDY